MVALSSETEKEELEQEESKKEVVDAIDSQAEIGFDQALVEEASDTSSMDLSKCLVGNQEITSGNVGIYIATRMLDCWERQHDADRKMRKKYAKCLVWVLGGQVLVSSIIFAGIGLKWLEFDQFTINLFVSVAYVQTLGLVYVVVKYLFSRDGHIVLKDITEYITGTFKKPGR